MRRTRLVAAAVLGALVASVGAVTVPAGSAAEPGHVPVWDHGAGGERYVAFGDSFVSGPGIAPQRPGECARSEKAFPTLVATALEVQSFTDASCGGARLTHLLTAQGDNPPQLDALGADTTLVTFGTLGGNDVGIVGVATNCVFGDCAGTPDDANHAKVEAARAALTEGIRETRRRAPEAIVVVVGHGTYLPPGGCPDVLPITVAEADYLQGLIDHLSDVQEEVARAEGAAFVDVRDIPGDLDHTACAAPDQQWIRALETYGDGAPLHPSSAGMAAMAEQVLGVVEAVWAVDPRHPVPTPRPTPEPTPEPTPDPSKPAAPTPTSPTTPPTTPPTDPTRDASELVEEALDGVRFHVTCHTAHDGSRVARFKVRRGAGLVTHVRFRVGEEAVGSDRRAPFLRERAAGRMADLDGRLRARVTAGAGGASGSRTYFAPRPRCLR